MYMNKFLRFTLILVSAILVLAMLIGCSSAAKTTTSSPPPVTQPTTAPAPVITTTQPVAPATSQPVTSKPVVPTTTTATTAAQTVAPPTSQPKSGGTFVWYQNFGVPSIASPVDGVTDLRMLLPVMETLLRMDSKEAVIPGLAESWTVAPDKKSITFVLRKGIKFHDGTDFNAEAVKYNLTAVLKANVLGSAVLANVSSYDVLDPYTLRMNLTKYDSTLLLRLGSSVIGAMASPTALQKTVAAEDLPKTHCVGTGPFLFDSWQRDSFVKYKKNPNYWKPGLPLVDNIEIRAIMDLTVSIMSFKKGDAQFLENVDPVDAIQLIKEGFAVEPQTLQFCHSIIPDGNNPNSPFKDLRIRQALEYALDKKGMSEGIGMGYSALMDQLALTSNSYYVQGMPTRSYNVAKAKQLLADAGFPNGFKTKLVTDVRARKDTLVAIQTYLQEAGFQVTLDVADVARMSSLTRQGWEGILYVGVPAASSFMGLAGRFGTASDYVSFYRPPGWQAKWDAIYAESNDATRNDMVKEIIKIAYDQAIAVPIEGKPAICMVKPGVLKDFTYRIAPSAFYWEPEKVWLNK
jgi:peptide/nickel transport system substrate-binding protein